MFSSSLSNTEGGSQEEIENIADHSCVGTSIHTTDPFGTKKQKRNIERVRLIKVERLVTGHTEKRFTLNGPGSSIE